MSRVGTDVPLEAGEPATGDPGAAPDRPVRSWSQRRVLVWGGLFALVALPLVVAAVALRRPPWYPALDMAMTELRLRDVGTRHTPLIGLPAGSAPGWRSRAAIPDR